MATVIFGELLPPSWVLTGMIIFRSFEELIRRGSFAEACLVLLGLCWEFKWTSLIVGQLFLTL
jgi:hypothetical protein